MSQMVMIEEHELSRLRQQSSILEEYYELIDRITYECYPDVDIWIDTGNGYMVQLAVLHQAMRDLHCYRSRQIKKHRKSKNKKGRCLC